MKTHHIAGMAGSLSLALAAGTVATSMGATAQPAAPDRPEAAASSSDCFWPRPDHTLDIAPGDRSYNPRYRGTRTQLKQRHTWREDTYAVVYSPHRDVGVYIEDLKTGTTCHAGSTWFGEHRTNALDNRNTSVRTVIVPGRGTKIVGKWYREDAGGHRQPNPPAPGKEVVDGKLPEHKDAEADYDSHEGSSRGLAVGHGVDHGTTEATLKQKPFGAGTPSYAHATTREKHTWVWLESDKYGAGDRHKVEPNDDGRPEDAYVGTSGVLYNKSDQLRVCIMERGMTKKKCGRWSPDE